MYFQDISRLTVHRRNGFSPFHRHMLIVALLVSNLVWLQSKPRTGKVHATLCCTCAMDTAWSFSFMCCYRQCLGRCHGEIVSLFGPTGQHEPASWSLATVMTSIHDGFLYSQVYHEAARTRKSCTQIRRARGMHINSCERCVLKDRHLKQTTKGHT